MNFKFNYYNQLEKPDFILLNPNGKELAYLEVFETSVDLQLHDLSTLSFKTPKKTVNSQGKTITYPYYKDIKTGQPVTVEGIGTFIISSVNTVEQGSYCYKEIKAESLEKQFQEFGFYAENRLYKFYNPDDPTDEKYDASDLSQIPSVCGQIFQQAGININLSDIDGDTRVFDEWTITWIEPELKYLEGQENIVRTISESSETTTYSFMQDVITNTFTVMFLFNTLNKSIQVKFPDSIAKRTNIYISTENIANEVVIEERNDDLCTVLTCTGKDVDIRPVNSAGTNYICDWSYFMDEKNHKWMTQPLIDKLKAWQSEVDENNPEWTVLVSKLRSKYQIETKLNTENISIGLKLQDLEALRDQYLRKLTATEATGDEIATAEVVEVEHYSFDSESSFYETKIPFDRDLSHLCYKDQPQLVDTKVIDGYTTGRFEFSGTSVNGTFNENYLAGTIGEKYEDGYLYFSDGENKSYCKLEGESIVGYDESGKEKVEYRVKGFRRFTIYSNLKPWIELYDARAGKLEKDIADNQKEINSVLKDMEEISSRLNVQKYLSDTPLLLRELKNYWRESSYDNQGIAAHDNISNEETIDLANELMKKGKEVLADNCRPTLTLKIDAIAFQKLSEYKSFARELELGCIITVETENTHYHPALTSMQFSLDNDNFELIFANNLKDGEYNPAKNFAEKANYAADISRVVESNWSNLTKFNRRENSIDQILYNPLSKTLQLAQGNMHHQDFSVSDQGVVLRQFTDDSRTAFDPCQAKLLSNIFLFTSDGWQTCRCALGKIRYVDPLDGQEKEAYGALAEALVGAIIIGNSLFIANEDNTISLDHKGIIIKKPTRDSNGNIVSEEVVFHATTDGDVYLKGHIEATSGSFKGHIEAESGSFKGHIEATSGTIGKLVLNEGNLHSDNFIIETTGEEENKLTTLSFFNTSGGIKTPTTFVSNESVISPVINGGRINISESKISSGAAYIELGEGGVSKTYEAKLRWEYIREGTVAVGFRILVEIFDKTGVPANLNNTVLFNVHCWLLGLYGDSYRNVTLSVLAGNNSGHVDDSLPYQAGVGKVRFTPHNDYTILADNLVELSQVGGGSIVTISATLFLNEGQVMVDKDGFLKIK